MYLSRKVALLRNQQIDVTWINPREIYRFIQSLVKIRLSSHEKVDRVEVHSFHPVALALLLIFGVDNRFYLYDHNYSSDFKRRSNIYIFALKYIISKSGALIVVSEHLKSNYKYFIDKNKINDFVVETPFIPISQSDEDSVAGDPSIYVEFLKNYRTYFVNAAWKLVDDEQGNDLYGLQNSLEVFLSAFRDSKDVALVLIIGSDFKGKREALTQKAAGCSNVLILIGEYSLLSVLNAGKSILLRTTSTDGDSLSVREALQLNKIVIASDVAIRPDGVNTYSFGNNIELQQSMLNATKE